MRLKNLDLIGAILIVAINVGWAQLPSRPLIIGIILAVPLVLFLPGYTLTRVLFRKRLPDQTFDSSNNLILQPSLKIGQPVGGADHIILSLGLSMAIDVLIGFILNVFPIGLRLQSWTLSLGLVTTVFALLAAYLRRRDLVKIKRRPRLRITIYECLLFGLAILVATAAVWFSVIRQPATQADFTQFWVLPSNQAANSCAVRVGVDNMESTTVEYRITMTINGTPITTWPSVVLAPQKQWEQLVPITPGTANNMYVEAQLYRADNPENVYRDAHLTFHSLRESKDEKTQKCGVSSLIKPFIKFDQILIWQNPVTFSTYKIIS